jgi:1,2-dihydroxy-3-keto-5-methylthiopentene dioxygenase
MSLLAVWPDTDPTSELVRTQDADAIAVELRAIGVDFLRWDLVELPAGATSDQVLGAYADQIAALCESEGFITVDAVALARVTDDPEWDAKAAGARAKFLNEHTHADDEVRFFARGAGVFYLHVGGKVYAVLCTAGDYISVPQDTTHWFDMGTEPDFAAVRFFRDEEGWVGNFTGDPIAERFPDFDALAASAT